MFPSNRSFFQRGQLLLSLYSFLASAATFGANEIDYLRDVKPILKAHCFRCHGPLKVESGLRLDTKALAIKGGEGGPALVPGNVADSSLIQRISGNEGNRMPPEGDPLSPREIQTLKKWVAAGAKSPKDEVAGDPRTHWSFQSIRRPSVPSAGDDEWSRNPIDAFISRKHRKEKLAPRPIAERQILLRRLYLDLVGLPPSRKQLQEFLADHSPRTYERVVDRLLESPHYGERWGRHWLDVWRYSDWYGFQNQVRFSQKNIWHWRDWVVESLNEDKGYDRMVMEMLAGDEILPFDPSNLRATGLLVRNRNTDSREQWIRDTVEHTAKAFLGLTMACVQCHDHPYDPIHQEEYYRYRNIFEPVQVGIDSGGGGPGGVDLAGVARIFDRDRNAKTKFYIRGNDRTPDEDKGITAGVPQVVQATWTKPQEVKLPAKARIPHLREPVHRQTVARLEYNVAESENAIVAAQKFLAETKLRVDSSSIDNSTPTPGVFIVETFKEPRRDVWKTGRGHWNYREGVLTQSTIGEPRDCYLEAIEQPPRHFSLRLRVRITGGTERLVGVMFNRSRDGGKGEAVLLSATEDNPGLRFFFEYGDERHYYAQHARELPIQLDDEIVLRVDVRDKLVNVYVNDMLQQAYEVSSAGRGNMRLMTIDASAEFCHLRVDSLPEDSPMVPAGTFPLFAPLAQTDRLHPSHLLFANAVIDQSRLELEINKAELDSYKTKWDADSWRFLNAPLEGDEAAASAHKKRHDELAIAAQRAQRILALAKANEAQFKAEHELKNAVARSENKKDDNALAKAVEAAKKKLESATKQVITAEKNIKEPPPPKYSGLSGSYGTSSGRRLSLARWVTDHNNPLPARVAANHIWLRHFGTPLVSTVFDFGVNGSPPSHPDLLNWLAAELMQPSQVLISEKGQPKWINGNPSAPGWSMKHLHRLIVTSRAYRMASSSDKRNEKIDPDNKWLWRMPQQRMDAETVRDSVLFVAGTLDTTLGGPDIPCDEGMSTPRRSLYFHQSPERQMSFLKLFDGADTTECYQRHVSIVPHQALALFNSELSLVQSRRLARKLSKEIEQDDLFVEAAFEHVLSRSPSKVELEVCRKFLEMRENVYRSGQDTLREFKEASQPSKSPQIHARENLIHSLLNHHDFVTIK